MQNFDLVIIGSGPGGYRAAVLAALRGLSVAVVEKAQWGGCCLNRGCVPKKAWYQTAKLLAGQGAFSQRGATGHLVPDFDAAWRHQRGVVETVRSSYTDYLKRLGVAAFSGTARFASAHRIALDGGEQIGAQHIIVATGSSPFLPPQLPRTPGKILTTDDLFDHPPPSGKRVALIGSSVVGSEMAFILAMLGLEVVWLTHARPLAKSRYSQPALKALYQEFARCGIQVRTKSRVQRAEILDDGVRLTLPDGSQEKVAWVLLGAGRLPHTADLDLAAAGVATDSNGFIAINDYQQTKAPHIYAIGDVANPAMTSNHALAEAAVAVANIVAPQSRSRRPDAVPEAVYSALELARLGWNEDEAEDRGREPALGFASFEINPAALGESDTQGYVRLIADHDSGELLGAEIVGSQAGDVIHLLAAHYGDPAALKHLSRLAYNHPTRSEEIQNAAETLAAKWGLMAQVFGEPNGMDKLY